VKIISRKPQRGTVFLAALACCRLLLGMAGASWAAAAEDRVLESLSDMQYIVGGVYTPLFQDGGGAQQTPVASLYLDVYPVTNAQ